MGVSPVDPAQEMELAGEAMSMFDTDGALAHLSAAVRAFTEAGDRRGAAVAGARLGGLFSDFMGNQTAARVWFERSIRLIADEPPCIEQGWVAVAAMGCEVDDPAELLAKAELALDLARRFHDVNLETKALADSGLAHVQAGRVAEGMAQLDEAMALVCGAADDVLLAGKAVCSLFTACCYAADFERAASWAEPLRQRGIIGAAPGPPAFLSDHCASVQATALIELGRWTQAETLLLQGIADFEQRMPTPSYHGTIALAELRIYQGRLADAEALLLGLDHHVQALLPLARLHLARGDTDLALAVARRGIRAMAADRLRAVQLHAVVAAAALAKRDLDGAMSASADLRRCCEGLALPTAVARAAAASARVRAASGDPSTAVEELERAVASLDAATSPWLRATLLLQLAETRDLAGDRPGAVADAAAAAASFADLDARWSPSEVAVLARLAAPRAASTTSSRPHVATLAQSGKRWDACSGSTRVRLPDTKGLRYIAELVAGPGIERHVMDLVDRIEGVEHGIDRRRLGDAGPAADADARSSYRRRIEALRSEIDAALAAGHDQRAQGLQTELDELVGHLAAAFGLGGRDRRAASAAERARLNVTRAIRAATASLCEALPDAGAALDRGIRTGLYCRYEPDAEICWIVQS